MPEPTYARRGQLTAAVRTLPTAQSRTELAAMMAVTVEDAVRTFDEFARKLADVDAQLEVAAERINRIDPNEPAPCAACGLPDEAHMIDPDNAEDWQPQHAYQPPGPALPAWLATEPPCWRCGEPPEAHDHHDPWLAGVVPEPGSEHEHETAAVAAITVTYYVTAGPAAGPGDARENVRAIFDTVHDNSALEALREGLAYADTPAFLAGTSSPELAP